MGEICSIGIAVESEVNIFRTQLFKGEAMEIFSGKIGIKKTRNSRANKGAETLEH